MAKYILFSFLPDYDVEATLVAVVYGTDEQRDYLLNLLKTGGSMIGDDRDYLELICELPGLTSPIDLDGFTHFVQQD